MKWPPPGGGQHDWDGVVIGLSASGYHFYGAPDEGLEGHYGECVIVFVCTGNICRSPMAEAIATQLEKRHGGLVQFASAGTYASEGHGATRQAIEAAAEIGVAMRWHRSRQLTAEVVADADLLVALDQEHVDYIAEHFPEAIVELLDSVPDPYGLSGAVYRQVRDQIAVALEKRAGNWLSAG
ncbi:MAG: low molecular weight protein arginine phosphatase [Acidimicrobiia bacterium]